MRHGAAFALALLLATQASAMGDYTLIQSHEGSPSHRVVRPPCLSLPRSGCLCRVARSLAGRSTAAGSSHSDFPGHTNFPRPRG